MHSYLEKIELTKAAYEIDEYLKDFSTARIPIRRQVIINGAIAHLVANVLPSLVVAWMAFTGFVMRIPTRVFALCVDKFYPVLSRILLG